MTRQNEHLDLSGEDLSRRHFLQHAALGAAVVAGVPLLAETASEKKPPSPRLDFPIVDYHVHLSGAFTIEKTAALANTLGVKFGILEHTGPGYKIVDDSTLRTYLDMLQKYPVYRGLQPVYPDWAKPLSKELLCQLDYILMDALTMPEKNGGWLTVTRVNITATDKEAFMARYFDFNVRILAEQPIDIFGWPTFLPASIRPDYDVLWTEERMQKLIDLAVKRDIAIEIHEGAKVPKPRFITMAKAAGAKFSFGTDSHNDRAGKFEYCFQMARQCGLTQKDMFQPKPDGQKAVQRAAKAWGN